MIMADHTFLWLLTQRQNRGFDTYDACVVAADSAEEARFIVPGGYPDLKNRKWAYSFDGVTVEKIGVTNASRKGKVIIESFNAG